MTSMAFGGGPSLDQRRDFAGLKDGTQVPGYRGYIPQIKYRVGKTYGNDTRLINYDYNFKTPLDASPVAGKPPVRNSLPDSTGDNKYTQNMVPGYTGYIPRMPFKFGDTYKVDCDYCIDDHMSNMNKHGGKGDDLRRSTKAFPKLQSMGADPGVKNHLNTYRDTHPDRPLLMEDKRSPTEPPIPGYRGFVPRIDTTEMGLGCRYHETTKKGLEDFWNNTNFQATQRSAPVDIHRSPATEMRPKAGTAAMGRRLYLNDGMIPRYTGYVPQRRFNFGQTYGDTTRSLNVCAHDKPTFGEFLKTKPREPVISSIC